MCLPGFYYECPVIRLNLGFLSHMYGEFLVDTRNQSGIYLRITESTKGIQCIESGNSYAQPGEGLTQLQSDGSQPDHRHSMWQICLFEQGFARQDPLAEITPGGWNDRLRPSRNDKPVRMDDLIIHLYVMGGYKCCMPFNQVIPGSFTCGLNHPIRESVATGTNLFQYGGNMDSRSGRLIRGLIVLMSRPVDVVRNPDESLGRHTASPGTGCSQRPLIYQQVVIGDVLHLPQGRNPGTPGTNNNNVRFFVHDDLRNRDIVAEVYVLYGIEDGYAIASGFLKGLAPRNHAHAAGALIDDGRAYDFLQIILAG